MFNTTNISKLLPSCKGEKRFFAVNGESYSNLYELLAGLQAMNDNTFAYHVNKEKNDFMNWVRDVFDDSLLAKEIAKIRYASGMSKKVEARIKSLQKI